MLLELLAKYEISVATFVFYLRVAGTVLGLLALWAFFRMRYLSNALTISKAKEFIRQQRKPFVVRKEDIRVANHAPVPIVTAEAEPTTEQPLAPHEAMSEYQIIQRTVLRATISKEAQAILDRIATPNLIDNDWYGVVNVP